MRIDGYWFFQWGLGEVMGSTWGKGFYFVRFYVVNWGLVVWVQGAGWASLGGWKILAKACDLRMLAWVVLLEWVVALDWVRVWDSCVDSCVDALLFVLFITIFLLCVMGQRNVDCYQ